MKKNQSKILIFDADIGYDAMDDFFIESSSHIVESGSTHHHMRLKPALGESIICRSKVISRGKKIIVSESEIFSKNKHQEKLVSKATVTLRSVLLDS